MNNGIREITYAVDENGRYTCVQSLGWEPKNVVNDQAWEVIEQDILIAARMVLAGKQSPLAYHCARHLMTIDLLASYVGLSRWRVKRHFKPSVFKRLTPEIVKRYADLFGLTPAELHHIPEGDNPLLKDIR
ncbi:MAG: hypothetical protein WA151_05790 [Desulfatirhabdiaceae bacterium]